MSFETFAGRQFTLIGALSPIEGFVLRGCRIIQHTVQNPGTTAEDFEEYVSQNLVPIIGRYDQREPNSVLIIDNASIHHCDGVLEDACRQRGTLLRFLSPYSPDYNPIEEAFSELKRNVRRDRTFYRLDPIQCIMDQLRNISIQNVRAYCQHSGYLIVGDFERLVKVCLICVMCLIILCRLSLNKLN